MEDRSEDDLTMPVPDVGELLQEAPELPAVPVTVELGTVYRLPARRTIVSSDAVGTTSVGIAPSNPRRSRITILADAEIWLARDSLSTGCRWPADVPFVGEHADSVFVRAETGTAVVSCVQELWAD